jgi:hypothetical protein
VLLLRDQRKCGDPRGPRALTALGSHRIRASGAESSTVGRGDGASVKIVAQAPQVRRSAAPGFWHPPGEAPRVAGCDMLAAAHGTGRLGANRQACRAFR